MTEKELKQLYWLKKEIKQLDKELQKLENMSLVKSPVITGLPFGKNKSDKVANYTCKIVDLMAILQEKKQECIDKVAKIEKFIDNIKDSEIRQIFRFRLIEGLSWGNIAGEMYMHRTTVTRKYYAFLKVAHNAHTTCDTM